ncbi:hypothetical protein NECAME_02705 [Necator americanus]|uniref:Transthyretin-like family protein n=1 Tax=Necator americanus TaxID=51031 RepID=W2TCH2_NECAM|nr:hypothetical protein NECAME_02705 [Necator americanus]ETN79279.1 hypothetical protein NECAME_02705 [Necator americanus]
MATLLLLLLVPCVAGMGGDLDIPSNVANRSMAIKGTLLCGDKGIKGATVRLFRVYQKDAADGKQQGLYLPYLLLFFYDHARKDSHCLERSICILTNEALTSPNGFS